MHKRHEAYIIRDVKRQHSAKSANGKGDIMAIRIGILGYGNLGRGVECAIRQNPDMELKAVFTRRNPGEVKILTQTAQVCHVDEAARWTDRLDVMVLCGGSATDLPAQTPEYARLFTVVDSFDTNAKIPQHFANVDAAAREGGKTVVISVGWDPGMFSLNRMYASAILPQGRDYTFWGRGVSQGHSDAIRRIAGVKDAKQYTIPVADALDAVRAALHLPTCGKTFPRDIGKERPCLNHHMGRCDGFCRAEMTGEEYNRRIDLAVQLLEGKIRLVTSQLEEEMQRAAEELQFEEAAVLRDRVAAIRVLGKRQKVLAGVCADTDVWGLYLGAKCCYAVLHYEEGQLTGREAELFGASALDDPAEILSALLLQYYGGRSVLPREICLPEAIEDQEVLEQLLTEKAGHRVTLRVPQRGERAQVLQMAETNAREEAERQTSSQERADRTLELLGKLLGLEEAPSFLESYDISNTGADDIVASMVVFHGSRPAKDRYRRFRIKDVEGHPDDYRSMEEVLTRRLTHYMEKDKKFMPLPDVMLIDGGEQHAKVARRVTERFGLAIPIFGMVKDDRHRTRALVTPEGREIGIQGTQVVFSLIGRIQEETHRFAITFNRESHGKSVRGSTLDGIPGVGEVRRLALLKHFKSLKAIKEASLEELQAVVPKNAAAAVYQWAHSTQDT